MITSTASAAIKSLQRAIQLLGISGQLVRADDPTGEALMLRFLRSHPQRRDEYVANSFGVNALVLTFPAMPELVVQPPKKFDIVLVGTPEQPSYALDTVLTRMVDDTVVAFTAYVRGHVV